VTKCPVDLPFVKLAQHLFCQDTGRFSTGCVKDVKELVPPVVAGHFRQVNPIIGFRPLLIVGGLEDWE